MREIEMGASIDTELRGFWRDLRRCLMEQLGVEEGVPKRLDSGGYWDGRIVYGGRPRSAANTEENRAVAL